MSQSNGGGATSATLTKQKAQLPNPFDLSDSVILDKVYLTHLHDDDQCDKDVLFNIVSNVVLQTRSVETRAAAASFKPEFRTMKLISSQMITTPGGDRYVHQTTMWILQYLKTFSWDAKALVTLAAFALEYGNLVYLAETSTPDQLAISLKQLNQVQTRSTATASALVGLVMEVLQHLREWAVCSSVGYDSEEVPSLSDALQEIPVVVYWTLAALVAATSNIVGLWEYNLSKFTERLSLADSNLKEHLKLSKEQIDAVEDYRSRRKAFSNPKGIVEFLKLLIHRPGSPIPQVFDGTFRTKTDIEVFKQQHVLLFISGLNRIDDEISLLNSIHERLQENPQEIVKGFKKEDFKILWIPIVDEWDESFISKFNITKNRSIKWYAVEHFSRLPGIGLIREKLNYRGDPIVPVLSPQGDIMNEDAMDLIFQWGIDAFPFRKIDGVDLTLKWKWFWDVTKKVNLGVDVKGDRYIFIYGGTDSKWVEKFTTALDMMKREAIKSVDAIIDPYQLGRNDHKIVPRFWIEIENKKLKKHQHTLDCEVQEIVKSMLCLKQDPQGWAILSKGSNVKVLGHGEPMYQTVADFEAWKEKVLQKEGFDTAFKEYYDAKLKEIGALQPCAFVNVDDYSANVIATISCPNPTCGRVMEVTSVNYKCCHRDAADLGGK